MRYATGALSATGGTVTVDGGDTVHTFSTSGAFTVSAVAPPTGMWRLTGTQCAWDPQGTGPAQCTPNAGRWKLTAAGDCVWDLWDSGPAQCELGAASAPALATFYDNIAYGGASFGANSDTSFVGEDWNDRISSVSVPPGMTATVFQHADYGGASLALTGENADLRFFPGPGADGTWNDAVSSIRVTAPPPAPPPARTVFLVNGSFTQDPDWTRPGSQQVQAIESFYGIQPFHWVWKENSLLEVVPPLYTGILAGARALAAYVAAAPPGEIILITHSHGGNVALLATYMARRPVSRLINLGTPVNWDLRWAVPPPVGRVCTASSWVDPIQFLGASPYQISNFSVASYWAAYYTAEAVRAFLNGDDASGWEYMGRAAFEEIRAAWWWESTKVEVWGHTIPVGAVSHSNLHEPPVWNSLPADCKRQ